MKKSNYEKSNMLEEGAIYESTKTKILYYFTGKYNKYAEACFENMGGERVEFPVENSGLLNKLSNNEIEKRIMWLEKGLEE